MQRKTDSCFLILVLENQPNILWILVLAKLSIWSYERSEIRSGIAFGIAFGISSGKTTRCFGRPVVGIIVKLGLDSCVLFVFTRRPERTRISFPTRIRKRITWFSRTVSGKDKWRKSDSYCWRRQYEYQQYPRSQSEHLEEKFFICIYSCIIHKSLYCLYADICNYSGNLVNLQTSLCCKFVSKNVIKLLFLVDHD